MVLILWRLLGGAPCNVAIVRLRRVQHVQGRTLAFLSPWRLWTLSDNVRVIVGLVVVLRAASAELKHCSRTCGTSVCSESRKRDHPPASPCAATALARGRSRSKHVSARHAVLFLAANRLPSICRGVFAAVPVSIPVRIPVRIPVAAIAVLVVGIAAARR